MIRYMPIHINPDASKKAVNFLRRHPVGVIATASSAARPHAATVYFAIDDDLNIYFVTKEQTTKHKNLTENPVASIAVFDAENQATLQASGPVEPINDIVKFMRLFAQILDISADTSDSDRPPVSKLFAGDYFMYKLTPTSLRLAEYMKPDKGDITNLFEIVIKND